MTWKIVVQTHKSGGIVVRTVADVNDRHAAQVAQAIEAALSRMSRKKK